MRTMTIFTILAFAIGCGKGSDDTGTDTGIDTGTDTGTVDELIEYYDFTSALTNEMSVSKSGQVFRQLLIDDLYRYLGDLTGRIDAGDYFPAAGDIVADLNFYFEFDGDTSGGLTHGVEGALQATYGDISSGKNIVGKLAGNDATGQHQDWSEGIVGWTGAGRNSPEEVVRSWFQQIDDNAVARANGQQILGPDNAPLDTVYLTEDGTDLRQLINKFLRGAVAYSQGTDDYLDDDIDGKGLNSEHATAEDGKAYTALEHAWDEAFGYFGAASDYVLWTDADIKASPATDRDGDGYIDLLNEVNWGHSVNAAKRDIGSSDAAATDFTLQAWEGFTHGRQLLADTAGTALTDAQMTELQDYRDSAVAAWEMSISATVVHYINDLIADLLSDASVSDVAKHYSELKGFSLSLQFNPRSMVSSADFATFQNLIGESPYETEATAYIADLISARDILMDSYGFDASNEGDESGSNGW